MYNMLALTSKFIAIIAAFTVLFAHASGPTEPPGWSGSSDAFLPNGQPCCIPADLNGTGLTGGAFVLLTNNRQRFAVFALTYTPSMQPRWHLLEQYPVAAMKGHVVSIVDRRVGELPAIKSCSGTGKCRLYFLPSTSARKFRGEKI
jgi:hypothetical protein